MGLWWMKTVSVSAGYIYGHWPAVSQHWPHPRGLAAGTSGSGSRSPQKRKHHLDDNRRKWQPSHKSVLNPCTQTCEKHCWRLWEALVPKEWLAGSQKKMLLGYCSYNCIFNSSLLFFNSIGALKSRTYVIPSPLLSLAAGTEGPCRAASTGLYSHLPEVFLGRGGSVSLYWRG